MATQSVPHEWLLDDRMTVTLLDVLTKQAEAMKKKRG